jgi:hypothetical protein
MARQGTDFELFVKSIYQEIITQEKYENIKIEHDVKIEGRSGQFHQIDIYWEFLVAGVMHKVAVECKDYTSPVSIGKIRDFFGVLEDIGNMAGIFITKKGYQRGAIKYAESKGISLKTVQEPTEEDINSRHGIKEIHINTHALCINNIRQKFVLDLDWVKENTPLKKGDTISIGGLSNEIKVIDSSYNTIGTLHDIQKKLPRGGNCQNLEYTEKFDDGFLVAPTLEYKPLKILAINFIYDTYVSDSTSVSKFKFMAEATVKDILTGDTYLFNKTAGRESL